VKTSSRIEWRRLPADSARSVRNIWTILTKELNSFFCTSIGYTVILGYVLTTSLFFLLILHFLREQGAIPATSRPLTVFFSSGYILIIFMFLCSILSMRLFAREREMGTIEMLLTVPVSDWEVVLGKYLATVVYYLICISPSLVNSLVLFRPEFTLHLHGSIILPTLVILPLLLLLFTVMPRILQAAGLPRSRDIVAVALMFAVTLVTALALRATGVDRITQMTAYIPADQVDTDNDGMADWWEVKYGLDRKSVV
jgi:ABC-type transport system involved in multi-copper enzyme maturation permease subunit